MEISHVFVVLLTFMFCGAETLSVKLDANADIIRDSPKEYKGVYRVSRQSNFWNPGRPNDEFGPASFPSEGQDPFRAPNRGRPQWQNNPRQNPPRNWPDSRNPNNPFGNNNGFGFNNQGFQQGAGFQGSQRPSNNDIAGDFNPYDYAGPSTQRPEISTVAIPGMGTTASPCEQACQTTSQFDPLCGDNGITYINMARFRCAVNCGRRVRILRSGACPR